MRAIDEVWEECSDTDAIRADPACRLICHQLAFLMRTDQLNESFHEYNRLIDIYNAGE